MVMDGTIVGNIGIVRNIRGHGIKGANYHGSTKSHVLCACEEIIYWKTCVNKIVL